MDAAVDSIRHCSFSPGQRAFLDAPRKAIVATLRVDGSVEQTIVYYVRDGDTLWISANPDGGKANDLRRDPRISILVYADDGSAYLAIEGLAAVSDDITIADRIQLMTRYLGLEGALQEVANKPKPRPNARIRVLPIPRARVQHCRVTGRSSAIRMRWSSRGNAP